MPSNNHKVTTKSPFPHENPIQTSVFLAYIDVDIPMEDPNGDPTDAEQRDRWSRASSVLLGLSVALYLGYHLYVYIYSFVSY